MAATRGVFTIFLAHAFAYVLLGVLPRSGIAVLGIAAADPQTLNQFNAITNIPISYPESVIRFLSFDFGKTLDGAAVSTAILTAVGNSLPILGGAIALICLTVSVALFWSTALRSVRTHVIFEFVSFLPAYLPGFILLAASVLFGSVMVFQDRTARIVLLAFCSGLPPACLAFSILKNASDMELKADYVRTLRALGFSAYGLQKAIRIAILLHFLPSFDKLMTMTIGVLLFTEAIFSYPGFGSLVIRAVQRSDINTLTGVILLLAVTTAITRVAVEAFMTGIDPRNGAEGS